MRIQLPTLLDKMKNHYTTPHLVLALKTTIFPIYVSKSTFTKNPFVGRDSSFFVIIFSFVAFTGSFLIQDYLIITLYRCKDQILLLTTKALAKRRRKKGRGRRNEKGSRKNKNNKEN